MDMSASFRPAVEQCLPHTPCIVAVDHFHVIAHVMTVFQMTISSWAHKKERKTLLHRKHHLFLRAKEDLSTEEEQERAQLGQQLPVLEQTWRLKEGLCDWYAIAIKDTVVDQLDG